MGIQCSLMRPYENRGTQNAGTSRSATTDAAIKILTYESEIEDAMEGKNRENMKGIHTVRKSRGGDIVIEMERGTNGGALEKFAKDTLGEECKIKRMAPKVIYEIKDLDPTIDKEELQDELSRILNRQKEEIEIKTIRFGYGRTKMAIVTLPASELENLGQENKLKIGFTNLDLKGQELCRRCGGLGHQINGCEAIRCCILCTREGIHASQAEHIAGATNYPQYKKLAHCLLNQTTEELGADIVLISEPLYNPGNWTYSPGGKTAIWITNKNGIKRLEDKDYVDEDFSAVRIRELTIVSTYFSPNISIDVFTYKVKKLIDYLSQEISQGNNILIGGDFNAKSPAWGSKEQDLRGTILLEEMLGKNIFPCIPEGGHTFERGNSTSNIDFIATTRDLQSQKYEFSNKVINIESASDHKYLLTELKSTEDKQTTRAYTGAKWKITRAGITRLGIAMERIIREEDINERSTYNIDEESKFLNSVFRICNEALDKADTTNTRDKGIPWWNPEIKKQRGKVQKLRRAAQKARKKGKTDEREALTYLYKLAKKNLQRLISRAKDKAWRDLCETIDKDIWGKPYKMVIRQVKSNNLPAALSLAFADTVLKGLFPQGNNPLSAQEQYESEEEENQTGEPGENPETRFPEVSTEEILKASKLLKIGKAPGIDGLQPEIIKAMVEFRPDRFTALFNGILKRGKLPKPWKKARTILLRKEGNLYHPCNGRSKNGSVRSIKEK
ncbi:uncharacterized protein LOC143363896 [Halictus rubicundus]|uniref:uncharacterized protein LOC143363896 n=1 Tax=Halictus rubicundus TaxID=77578 RepID=UPI0040368479